MKIPLLLILAGVCFANDLIVEEREQAENPKVCPYGGCGCARTVYCTTTETVMETVTSFCPTTIYCTVTETSTMTNTEKMLMTNYIPTTVMSTVTETIQVAPTSATAGCPPEDNSEVSESAMMPGSKTGGGCPVGGVVGRMPRYGSGTGSDGPVGSGTGQMANDMSEQAGPLQIRPRRRTSSWRRRTSSWPRRSSSRGRRFTSRRWVRRCSIGGRCIWRRRSSWP